MTGGGERLAALIRQFATFCGVGVINTIVGLAVILLLSEVLDVHYGLANIAGYAVGLAVGFVLHRNVTFSATAGDKAARLQMLHFIGVFAVAYLVQFAVLVLLHRGLGWPNVVSQILAVGVYTVISFIGNRFFTFREKRAET